MFENLSTRFREVVKKIKGQSRLTEENIDATLREIRRSLLEADVALSVIQNFLDSVQKEAIGQKVASHLNPGQEFIKLIHQGLTKILGSHASPLNLRAPSPFIYLLSGLQGSGKTTTAAKLAKYLSKAQGKKVLLSTTDIYRPAAIEQLQLLSNQIQVPFYHPVTDDSPLEIAQKAWSTAKKLSVDILILDTAGRLHIDEPMMQEIKAIYQALLPLETLYIADSMSGQDAAQSAKVFNEALPLTGTILTKIDGDTRGGAALSIAYLTGKPIKFLGVGEKMDDLEPFYPDRLASRILDMGDIFALIEQAERNLNKEKSEQLARKIKKGKEFNFNDLLDQFEQLASLGGIKQIATKMPGLGHLPDKKWTENEKLFVRNKAIIQSMTPNERLFPKLINSSRKKRIANGAGSSIQEVNQLLKQLLIMQKMMKKFSKLPFTKRGVPNIRFPFS